MATLFFGLTGFALCLKETFDPSTQLDVFNDFSKTNEISEALNTLKIIINYARTTFADKDENINQFLKRIYVEGSLKSSELILKSRVRSPHLGWFAIELLTCLTFLCPTDH